MLQGKDTENFDKTVFQMDYRILIEKIAWSLSGNYLTLENLYTLFVMYIKEDMFIYQYLCHCRQSEL